MFYEWRPYVPVAVRRQNAKREMERLLAEIKDGSFAKKWIAENETGRHAFEAIRAAQRDQPIEEVGRRLRPMMSFLNAVTVTPEGDVQRARPEPVVAGIKR